MQKIRLDGVIFLNGKFLRPAEAKISVLEPAFLYGWGLFETMRSYKNRIVYFEEHIKRIKNSCRLIGIKFTYSVDELRRLVEKAVKINDTQDAYVKLALYKTRQGTGSLIMARRYKPYAAKKYKQGFRACIYSFRQNENYFLGRMKSTNYLFYQLAYSAAKKKKFDESVILNHRGYICEGSRSNIFWIKDDILFTPALECGCLDGITRKVIFDLARKYNFLIFEGNFTLQNLHKSDGAFLSNSLMGIMPLTCLERQPIAKGFVDKTTKFLMQKYNSLLRHEI